ncbi:hypothetical protein [Laspinema olomoucense]|uniref:Uncharacterized protein n=1 Tax=Laspinema olomoucense D3b TaxID=2953688 RepID=A0ABT2N173_9CYAN|nr:MULTISPECIES: hypothetical protein [unclassified Laspinema]MCT7976429.1 hypothetical protein [Laspinema sp. D3b]MCT7991575.1 hypothetical protein [Laspinema sp. D3a]MCT7994586.1 hypothetical protein [Laspinema sp. D3c]
MVIIRDLAGGVTVAEAIGSNCLSLRWAIAFGVASFSRAYFALSDPVVYSPQSQDCYFSKLPEKIPVTYINARRFYRDALGGLKPELCWPRLLY